MKEIIGMIHLANGDIKQALDEVRIYEESGFDGIIVEDYYAGLKEVVYTLKEISKIDFNLKIGINILSNYDGETGYDLATKLTSMFDISFIQVDAAYGKYLQGDFTDFQRKDNVKLYGGVWPKYYTPCKSSNFEADLISAIPKTDAIVITGKGTGKETPIDKIKYARDVIQDHKLIVGAGVDVNNAYEQLSIANGCIVGTSVKKNGKTCNKVDKNRCKKLVNIIRSIKNY